MGDRKGGGRGRGDRDSRPKKQGSGFKDVKTSGKPARATPDKFTKVKE